jgi:hypothetical protein
MSGRGHSSPVGDHAAEPAHHLEVAGAPRTFLPWLPAPLAAGTAAILGVDVLTRTEHSIRCRPSSRWQWRVGLQAAIAAAIMIAFEPRARAVLRRLLRGRRTSVTEP